VVKLTFASGLTLRVTPDHLLRRTTNVKNLWVKAKDVLPGDYLKSPVRIFKPACTLDVAEDEAYVTGCIYGDGCISTSYVTISQSKSNSDVIQNIQKRLPLVFSLYDKGERLRTLGKYVLVSRMFHLHTTDKKLLKRTRFLLRNPSIDNILLLADKPLWAFFAGVFDTDGDFNHVHGRVVAARIYPTTSAHELRLLLYALRRLGIYGRIHRTRKGFPVIQITGQDISRFAEGIRAFSAKVEREGHFEIEHMKSIARGMEKVAKVEEEPYDGQVYDLSVGKYHNYESSLIYIHNCIDEFDKLKPEDRSALHEVMEQQTCSVAKGGIVATLNARTSILSAANPMYGKYDPYKNITENVNLPVPLLTRFDLIYIVRDMPEKEKDSLIASHILEIHRDIEHAAKPAIEIDLFSKYLAYTKQVEPVLTQEAIDLIRNYYMDMRKVESEAMITVTPRQLEGLVRLATARARLLLKDKVEADDASRAIYLVEQMLRTAGVDVNTGKMDVGVLYGKPQSETSKSKTFMDVLKGLSGTDNNEVEEKLLLDELMKTGKFTDDGDVRKYLERAKREGLIFEKKPGYWAKA
jgi:intein/homing endonuclease